MLLALITDTHWGVRGDNLVVANYFKKFYNEIFFPYLEQNGIKTIVHLGDIVDRRKYINYVTARNLKEFVAKSSEMGIDLHVIIGNHDTTYKNTNEVNSMNELFHNSNYKITYYSEPKEVEFDDLKVAFLPWICSGNYNESIEFINNTQSQILFGHLELSGFEMYKGHVNDHGFNPNIFDKFDMVMSGHYHHKSSRGNINYLGAPYEMTWSDYNDDRGFHVFDTDTRILKFINNPLKLFSKVLYNDKGKTLDDILSFDEEQYKNKYVKIIIQNKDNPYWFDMFIDKIEKTGVTDLQVVEDHVNLDSETDENIVNEADDTMTILSKVVSQLDNNIDKKLLNDFLKNLYNEALSLENN